MDDVLASTVTKTVDSHGANPVPAVPASPWTGRSPGATPPTARSTRWCWDPADGAPDSFQHLAVTGLDADRPHRRRPRAAGLEGRRRDLAHRQPGAAPRGRVVAAPSPTDAIHGLRFTFTSTTGAGADHAGLRAAKVVIRTQTRDNVTTIPANTTVTVSDRASSHVTLDAQSDAGRARRRRHPPPAADGPRSPRSSRSPRSTPAGPRRRRCGSTTGPVPVNTMVITEPDGSGDLVAQGLTFTGFVGADIEVADGRDQRRASSTSTPTDSRGRSRPRRATPPAATAGHRVAGFTVTFTGTMAAAQYAVLPFRVTADPVTGVGGRHPPPTPPRRRSPGRTGGPATSRATPTT